MERGQFDAALTGLQSALGQRPTSPNASQARLLIARVYERIRDGRFSEAFCAKGVHSATMMKIPVKAVTNERLALLGAAKLVL